MFYLCGAEEEENLNQFALCIFGVGHDLVNVAVDAIKHSALDNDHLVHVTEYQPEFIDGLRNLDDFFVAACCHLLSVVQNQALILVEPWVLKLIIGFLHHPVCGIGLLISILDVLELCSQMQQSPQQKKKGMRKEKEKKRSLAINTGRLHFVKLKGDILQHRGQCNFCIFSRFRLCRGLLDPPRWRRNDFDILIASLDQLGCSTREEITSNFQCKDPLKVSEKLLCLVDFVCQSIH